jgi:hypothetical protein
MSSTFPYQGRVGAQSAADGSYQPFKLLRTGEAVNDSTYGNHYAAVQSGVVFTLNCGPVTTTTSAGNLIGASAAAATQFAIWNPVGSGVNFSLLEFALGQISGTPTGGPVAHGFISVALGGTLPTIASVGNANALAPRNNLAGSSSTSKAFFVSTYASTGTALTGATAPGVLKIADFSSTATAEANVTGYQPTVEAIEGKIVLAPGSLWLPLFPGAGTTSLWQASVTWAELPV